jgi:hypothetical protein
MIIKREDNKQVIWGYRYRYKINGVWHKKENYHKDWSKRQAQEEEIKFIESLKVKTGDTLMFSQLYEMYFAYKKDKLKVRAYRDIKTSCERHILPYFSDKLLNDIKSHDIEKWQQALLKATYIKNGVKQIYANRQLEKIQINMNAMMKFAYDRELIDRNPFKSNGIVKRRVEPKSEEVRYITVDEFNRLMNAIELSNDDELLKHKIWLSSQYYSGVVYAKAS